MTIRDIIASTVFNKWWKVKTSNGNSFLYNQEIYIYPIRYGTHSINDIYCHMFDYSEYLNRWMLHEKGFRLPITEEIELVALEDSDVPDELLVLIAKHNLIGETKNYTSTS